MNFIYKSPMLLSPEGDPGAGGNPIPDDKDKDKDKNLIPTPAPSDDKVTLTKAELDEKLKQKFAEGARKASEGKLPPNPQDPNVQTLPNAKLDALEKEVQQLRGEKLALSAGIDSSFCEDAVAILRGKSIEISEASIKQIADKHPEWKKQANNNGQNGTGPGALPLGGVGGQATPPNPDEKAQARKLFGR
jgi:hypothetical protein